MNKKILYIVIVLSLILTIVSFITSKNSINVVMASVSAASKCDKVSNNNYKLNFVTNSNKSIVSIDTCVNCDKVDVMPVPEKQGFIFAGWYYDEKFNKRFEGTTTKDVKYLEKYDINGCIIGYEDITLYARWIPNIQCPNEISLTVNFETNGGSKVDKVVLTSRNITNFKLNIPIPTKENYNFNGWYYDIDLKNKVDLSMIFNPDLSKFECKDFEITLYARWVHKKTVTLNGVLKDANSVVMQYYFVSIDDNDYRTVTDKFGKFELNDVIEGEHKVTIKTLKNKEIASSNMVLKYGNDKYEDDYAFIYGDDEDKLLLNLSVDKYNNLDIEKRIPLYKNVYFCVGISAVAVLLLMLYLLNKNYKKYEY